VSATSLSKAGYYNEVDGKPDLFFELNRQRAYKRVSRPGRLRKDHEMSEDTTQQLLVARVNHLISIVEPISGQLINLEEHVNERLDNLENQQAALSARFDNLETKVDQRLRDTRPIWENVLSQLAELHKEVEELRAETSSGFRAVDRKIRRSQ